jgi:Ni/Co efflux regulator RcnB
MVDVPWASMARIDPGVLRPIGPGVRQVTDPFNFKEHRKALPGLHCNESPRPGVTDAPGFNHHRPAGPVWNLLNNQQPITKEFIMNKTIVASAIVALSMGTAGSAFAERDGDTAVDWDRSAQSQYHRPQVQHSDGYWQRDHRDNRSYDYRRRDGRNNSGYYYQRRDGRGAGPDHAFYAGQRLPMYYRHGSYVVNDWHRHRLSAPPYGYHWVQTGSDYVLVAIATGIILQLMLN